MESYNKLVKIWGNISDSNKKCLDTKISIHQERLMDYFHVGPYYYYVFDVTNSRFEHISENMKSILGYEPDEMDVASFIGKIHPNDIAFFLQCENRIIEFLKTLKPTQIPNYKFSYDYRIMADSGQYVRILQQVLTIDYDENTGSIFTTLGIHSDISHIKSIQLGNRDSILSFIGLNGEKSYTLINSDLSSYSDEELANLSLREKQIVGCLLNGLKSQEIAENLFISKHTVDTHRRKILQKLNVIDTKALILKLSKTGWI